MGGGNLIQSKKGDAFDIKSYSCTKPNICVVDFIKNGIPNQIAMDYVGWNATEFFSPKVVK